MELAKDSLKNKLPAQEASVGVSTDGNTTASGEENQSNSSYFLYNHIFTSGFDLTVPDYED